MRKYKLSFLLLFPVLILGCHNNPPCVGEECNPPDYCQLNPDDPQCDPCLIDPTGSGCKEPPEKRSVVHLYSIPEGVKKYQDARVYIDDQELELYSVLTNSSHVYTNPNPSREENAVGIFKLYGKVTLTIQTEYDLTQNINVLPSTFNILPLVRPNERTITLEIYNPGQYVIEPNRDVKRTIHLFVDELVLDQDLNEVDVYQEMIVPEEPLIYFGPGIYNKNNSSYIDANGFLQINDNTTVFIDYGAVLQAKFRATNKNNIRIIGGGVLDGTVFSRTEGGNSVPVNLRESTGITIQGISILDPGAWVTNLYYCTDIIIENLKIISSRANGDGITLQSCQNATINNCFVRSFDDSLVVKNYTNPEGQWTNPSARRRASKNLHFSNIVIWTDLAQSMEIGYETAGEEIYDISFENITVLHNFHKPVISIHNANDAYVHDIIYENITVEDASMGLGDASVGEAGYISTSLIEFTARSSNLYTHVKPIGDIADVLVQNLLVKKVRLGLYPSINIIGQLYTTMDENYGNISRVRNVTLDGIKIVNTIVDDNYDNLVTNNYTENLLIQDTLSSVTGAMIKRLLTIEELRALKTLEIFVN